MLLYCCVLVPECLAYILRSTTGICMFRFCFAFCSCSIVLAVSSSVAR